jgi:hypothetical protein
MAEVGDLVQRTENGRTGRVLDGWAIERSGGAVCGLHHVHGDEECGFLGWPYNQGRRFVSGLASKPLRRFLISLDFKTDGDGLWLVWPQNYSDGFCRFGLRTGGDDFWRFGLKTYCDGFLWFGLKTCGNSFLQLGLKTGGDGFSRFGLKIGSSGLVIWTSKSPRWFLGLGLKTKQASVCRLRHKTDGGRSAWDTRQDLAARFTWKQVWLGFPSLAWRMAEAQRRVVHVAQSWRLRRRQAEDGRVDATGCVRSCYPTFAVFNVLDDRGIIVI